MKYSFPTTTQSPCHGYPGPIANQCKIKLYYKQNSIWTEAYAVNGNLNTGTDPSICEVIDSIDFFMPDAITAQEWKVEMVGFFALFFYSETFGSN